MRIQTAGWAAVPLKRVAFVVYFLAQRACSSMAEQWPFKPLVRGSSPLTLITAQGAIYGVDEIALLFVRPARGTMLRKG